LVVLKKTLYFFYISRTITLKIYYRFKYTLSMLVLIMSITFFVDASRQLQAFGQSEKSQLQVLQHSLIRLNNLKDNDDLIKLIAQKPLVLIGDSTHGTHEFYQQRINITRQLIQKKNFKLIFLEADWPNAYRINQYIQGSNSYTALQVLNVDTPHAVWLWNNLEMLNFIQWLRAYNKQLSPAEQKVSVYGMDIYSFDQSKQEVINYLQTFSAEAAQQAVHRYQCFSHYGNDVNIDLHRYGQAVSQDSSVSCEAPVVTQYEDFSKCRFPCPEQYQLIDADFKTHEAINTQKKINYLVEKGVDGKELFISQESGIKGTGNRAKIREINTMFDAMAEGDVALYDKVLGKGSLESMKAKAKILKKSGVDIEGHSPGNIEVLYLDKMNTKKYGAKIMRKTEAHEISARRKELKKIEKGLKKESIGEGLAESTDAELEMRKSKQTERSEVEREFMKSYRRSRRDTSKDRRSFLIIF